MPTATSSLKSFIAPWLNPPACVAASMTDLRGAISDLALMIQSTPRWMESAFIEASAQAQNFAASSALGPLALAQKAQPPPIVTYLPPGGSGNLKTPYL